MKKKMVAGNIVETQDLTKTFGEDIAVQSLNMQVPRGNHFWFRWSKWLWKNDDRPLINRVL
jgi:hypothetical protein